MSTELQHGILRNCIDLHLEGIPRNSTEFHAFPELLFTLDHSCFISDNVRLHCNTEFRGIASACTWKQFRGIPFSRQTHDEGATETSSAAKHTMRVPRKLDQRDAVSNTIPECMEFHGIPRNSSQVQVDVIPRNSVLQFSRHYEGYTMSDLM